MLALGIDPKLDLDLASKLKVPIDRYGFVQEVHPKLRPVEVATGGVFICGTV